MANSQSQPTQTEELNYFPDLPKTVEKVSKTLKKAYKKKEIALFEFNPSQREAVGVLLESDEAEIYRGSGQHLFVRYKKPNIFKRLLVSCHT